jgi:hypothetical protein
MKNAEGLMYMPAGYDLRMDLSIAIAFDLITVGLQVCCVCAIDAPFLHFGCVHS